MPGGTIYWQNYELLAVKAPDQGQFLPNRGNIGVVNLYPSITVDKPCLVSLNIKAVMAI